MRSQCPSIFLTSTAFVGTKAKPRAMRGLNLFVNKALEIFTFTQNIKNFIF